MHIHTCIHAHTHTLAHTHADTHTQTRAHSHTYCVCALTHIHTSTHKLHTSDGDRRKGEVLGSEKQNYKHAAFINK